jgi:hypothetical protein
MMRGADRANHGGSRPGAAPEILPTRRTLAAVALAASLAAPSPAGPFERLWSFLSTFWDAVTDAPAPPPQTKIGCGMDPNGQCNPAPAPQLEGGCGADPNGGCSGSGS